MSVSISPHSCQHLLFSVFFIIAILVGVKLYLIVVIWVFLVLCLFCFLAALGLRCNVQPFSSCGKRGLLFVVVHGRCGGFSCCGARALGV